MKIIRAGIEEMPLVLPLFHQYRSFYRQEKDEAKVLDFLSERLRAKDTVLFLSMTDDGAAAGFAHLFPIFSSVSVKRHWLLNDLFVHPDHRRKKVGEMLLRHSQIHARSTGAKGLFLQTEADNISAQNLYEKLGFRKDPTACYYEWLL